MNDIILYHGSKNGIKGNIKPCSRPHCDFGTGFYMGTDIEQAKTLVSNQRNHQIYTLNLKLSNIKQEKILTLSGLEWVYPKCKNHPIVKIIGKNINHPDRIDVRCACGYLSRYEIYF